MGENNWVKIIVEDIVGVGQDTWVKIIAEYFVEMGEDHC